MLCTLFFVLCSLCFGLVLSDSFSKSDLGSKPHAKEQSTKYKDQSTKLRELSSMTNESTHPKAYIGLGSNLGDRAGNLLLGIRGMLDAGLEVSRLSQVYETGTARNVPAAKLSQPGRRVILASAALLSPGGSHGRDCCKSNILSDEQGTEAKGPSHRSIWICSLRQPDLRHTNR